MGINFASLGTTTFAIGTNSLNPSIQLTNEGNVTIPYTLYVNAGGTTPYRALTTFDISNSPVLNGLVNNTYPHLSNAEVTNGLTLLSAGNNISFYTDQTRSYTSAGTYWGMGINFGGVGNTNFALGCNQLSTPAIQIASNGNVTSPYTLYTSIGGATPIPGSYDAG